MYKGEILLCLQEERLTNKKNFFGYPKKSIDYCINFVKKNHLKLIRQYLQHKNNFNLKYPVSHYFTIKDFHDYFGEK